MRRAATDAGPLRALRLTEALFGAVVDGATNRELEQATGYSPSNVSRDLRLLEQAGWARRLGNGRWTLTEKPAALLKVYQFHLEALAERAKNFDLRAAAGARQML